MACHPKQPSNARRFSMRAIVAALTVTVVLYLGGAFLTLHWDFRQWPEGIRASLAVTDLIIGGFAALVAGISCVEGV